MALRRLNIDFEALARAMATQGSDENDYYLDTHTGRIMRISTDVWNALEEGETIAGSLNAWQQEELIIPVMGTLAASWSNCMPMTRQW